MTRDEAAEDAPVVVPITGELDLHTIAPREAKGAVEAYLEACRERGILDVRIVHGKGTGAMKATVHALLNRTPWVLSFKDAGAPDGGWGATMVVLAPLSEGETP